MKRTAFFISDGTGLTAEALGHALLAQFEKIDFERITVPYIDDEEKAHDLVKRINKAAEVDGAAPLVLDTIVNSSIREIISTADGFMIDIFGTFVQGPENPGVAQGTTPDHDPIATSLFNHGIGISGR